jgi:alpha-tubulin suppressor-like RCC1 family protein
MSIFMNQSTSNTAILFTVLALGLCACSSNSGSKINTGGSPDTGGATGSMGGSPPLGGAENAGGNFTSSDGATGSGGTVLGGNDAGIKCKNEDDHDCGFGCCQYGLPFVCGHLGTCYASESVATKACEGAAIVTCKFKGPYFIYSVCPSSGGCWTSAQGNELYYIRNIGTDGIMEIISRSSGYTEIKQFNVKAGESYTMQVYIPRWLENGSSRKFTYFSVFPGVTLIKTFEGSRSVGEPSAKLTDSNGVNLVPETGVTSTFGTCKVSGSMGKGDSGGATLINGKLPLVAKSITVGYGHTCAAISDGTVWCWGNNTYGQLANGKEADSKVPELINGIKKAKAVAAGSYFTCALLEDGTVICWGANAGSKESKIPPEPVAGLTNAIAISAGAKNACALLKNGEIVCWGNNKYGQLGNGSTTDSLVPVPVSGITNAIKVASGWDYNCALLSSGEVQCWGWNYEGKLGDGTTIDSYSPVPVKEINNAVALEVGPDNACVVLSGGTVKCWGKSTNPLPVIGITNAVDVEVGGGHACALLTDGTIQCWGSNGCGELGNGNATVASSVPVTVSCISNATSLASGLGYSCSMMGYSGNGYTCALLQGGKVQCWGNNESGGLGSGNWLSSFIPITVYGF